MDDNFPTLNKTTNRYISSEKMNKKGFDTYVNHSIFGIEIAICKLIN